MLKNTLYYNALDVNKLLCEATRNEQEIVDALIMSAKLLVPLHPTVLQSLYKALCSESQID